VGRGSWVVGRGSWPWSLGSWVVGHGSWSWSSRSVSLSFAASHSVSRSVAALVPSLVPSQDQSLVPSLVPSQPQVNPALWRPTLALALHARVGGARLRLTLLHSIAARTAAARLRLGGVAPRLLPSLCTRKWAVHGFDLRSRTASRLILPWPWRVCSWAGGARLQLNSRTSSRLVLLRPGRRAALTYALAPPRGTCCCAAVCGWATRQHRA